MKKRYNNNDGFTLVEILVAVAIVAIIVAPILKGITTSMKVNNKSDKIMNQTAVAQSVMEAISNESFESVARELDNSNTNDLTVLPKGMYEVTNPSKCEHKELLINENASEAEIEDLFHVGLGNVLHEAVVCRFVHWVSHSLRPYSVGMGNLVAEILKYF